ncbi:MAG TPA: KamA family radical SAM protein [Halothiobacillaceae bacterium]|nr:KamA family radical SAM protein [Halothiobacillaceae bacterium]
MTKMNQEAAATDATNAFPELLTDYIKGQIAQSNNPEALLRQFKADPIENQTVPGFAPDPVGDLDSGVFPGLLHKYHGRVLLILTGSCAVHCRYCFRRHFPYQDQRIDADKMDQVVAYLNDHPEITEVILSGGDPLSVSNRRLAMVIRRLTEQTGITRLRLHSRTPTVNPQRVDAELVAMLASTPVPVVLVTHVNHPDELGRQTKAVMQHLSQAGVHLLNQTVLLKGVNDDLQTQLVLSERLFSQRILPYYLHQLDQVAGGAHFYVPIEEGLALLDQMRARLPGYLVPRYVCEPPGSVSKQHLA